MDGRRASLLTASYRDSRGMHESARPVRKGTRRSARASLRQMTAVVLLATAASVAHGETLIALGGINQPDSHAESTYAWQFEYQENLLPWLAASLSWINEGHLPDDSRDGATAQLWVRTPRWYDLTFSFGAGPYIYFDTEARELGSTYSDAHGIGGIATASVTADLGRSWFMSLNASGIYTPGDVHTYAFLVGVGYRFAAPDRSLTADANSAGAWLSGREQLQVFGGMKIFNDLNAQQRETFGVDYHLALTNAIAWSATWFDDPGSGRSLHDRAASQVWLFHDIDPAHLTLSVGLGGYYQFGTPPVPATTSFERISGLSGIRAEWEWSPQLSLIFTWYRKFTTDNTDRDLLTLGAAYRF
jgi:hypothetical protein